MLCNVYIYFVAVLLINLSDTILVGKGISQLAFFCSYSILFRAFLKLRIFGDDHSVQVLSIYVQMTSANKWLNIMLWLTTGSTIPTSLLHETSVTARHMVSLLLNRLLYGFISHIPCIPHVVLQGKRSPSSASSGETPAKKRTMDEYVKMKTDVEMQDAISMQDKCIP